MAKRITTAATLTVDVGPSITTNPISQTVTAGNSVTFTAAASANPTATVQWEVSSNGGSTFSIISGAISTTYTFTSNAGENGDEYEAVFTNAVGSASTTAATLTVDFGPSITTNPNSQTVTAGNSVTFTAAASANPTATVQWEVSSNGGSTFSNISGATSTTYSFTSNAGENGDEYEAVFTNSVGSASTTAATLTVDFGPSITTNPNSQTVTAGNSVTFTAAASANPAATVQWEVSSNGGSTFSNISGATSTTYTFTANASENSDEYEAVFTKAVGSASRQPPPSPWTLGHGHHQSKQPDRDGGQQRDIHRRGHRPIRPPRCSGRSAATAAARSAISGATSTSYSFSTTAGENGDEYEAVFTAGVACDHHGRDAHRGLGPTVTTNPSSQTVTAGNRVTFTAAASGNPAPTVQWEVSSNGGSSFTNISGATSTTYSFTTQRRRERRRVQGGLYQQRV